MFSNIDSVKAGHVFAAMSFAMAAAMNACVKGLDNVVPLNQILVARFLFGLMFIYPLVHKNGGIAATFTSQRKGALINRGVLGLAAVALSYFAIQRMPLAPATAIWLSAPLFVTALAGPIIKERVNSRQWLAVFIGFNGMILLVDPFSTTNAIYILPAMLIVIAAIAAAISNLQVRDLTKTERSITIISWYFMIALIPNAILLFYAHNWDLTLAQGLLLLGVGLTGALLMYSNTQAYRYLPAASVASYEYTGLLWAGLMGYFIWHEVPSLLNLTGAVIIVLSGFLATRTTQQKTLPSKT